MTTSLLLCFILPQQNEETIRNVAARKLIDAMNNAYATCKTYQDTGTVTCGDQHLVFTTFFKRPNRLYVEFSSTDYYVGRYVLWMKGSLISKSKSDIPENRRVGGFMEALTWDDRDKEIETNDLEMALAGYTGISLGGASTIPGILFPKAAYGSLPSQMPDLIVEKSTKIGKRICDVLYSKSQDTRFWFDKESHLMLKMDEALGDKRNVLTFSPLVGKAIPDSQFLFTPPKGKSKNKRS